MFGYIRTNIPALSPEEHSRYRACYCGLCRALGKRHGAVGRMALTYDLTFLSIFLNSLYEPEEETGTLRCLPHPVKPHDYVLTSVTDYAADMTIALMYQKCMDDWQDEKKPSRRLYARMLEKSYRQVKRQWPEQVECIERSLRELSAVEQARDPSPDAAAACFGRLMAGMFLLKKDYWSGALRVFGDSIGRFIYLADAAVDYRKDKKKQAYNPFLAMGMEEDFETWDKYLTLAMARCTKAFERLPLVQDKDILDNILYSGVWIQYRARQKKNSSGGNGNE